VSGVGRQGRRGGVSGFGDQGLGQGRRGIAVADGVLLQQGVVAHAAVADAYGRVRGVLGAAVRGHYVLTGVALLRGLLAIANAVVVGGYRADVVGRRPAGTCYRNESCEQYELRRNGLSIIYIKIKRE